ncbi:DUF3108 domain-containing protein [Tenacibaculum maritimum]|uniref:DUF3108 domain-containing protein n=1 Tax=Tenacibaculum maritimum TaxID=107401 RepID=UPI00388CF564
MRKKGIIIFMLFLVVTTFSQEKIVPFKDGEWLRFKMSYSGFLKAGNATLSLKEEELNGKEVFHARGKGWTTGMIKWFFKVNDDYQSYFDKRTGTPYLFKRKIDEGGYKKNKIITFYEDRRKAYIQDFIKKKDTILSAINVQDMISTFYFLRKYNTKNLKLNEEINVNMFFDEKMHPFKLKYLGSEVLKTKFGKIKTQKFRPLVQAGRVFKAKESVTIWITADDNKIPIKMKASLSVGSLRAELDAYKGLANPFPIIYD